MTNTEKIATKLFGFKREPSRDDIYGTCYIVDAPQKKFARVWIRDGGVAGNVEDWPDLADHNWIRRMEDALNEEQYSQYCLLLHTQIPALDRRDKTIDAMKSTPAQRVAAAVKVLEGQG